MAQQRPFTDQETQDIIRRHMEDLREGGVGTLPYLNGDPRLDRKKVSSLLIPYLSDPNEDIRYSAASFLGSYGDREAVMPLGRALEDNNRGVRRAATQALCHIGLEELQPHRDHLIPFLLREGGRVEGAMSAAAIELLGNLRAATVIPEIKKLRDSLASTVTTRADKKQLIALVEDACTRALAKLGDSGSRLEVINLLRSPSVAERVKGIRHASYLGREICSELVPLLDDKRDAIPGGSTWEPIYLRVCDLALQAAVVGLALKTDFLPTRGGVALRFKDAQIEEVRRLIKVDLDTKR